MNLRSAVLPYLQVHRQEVGHSLQAQGRDVCYTVEPQVEHLADVSHKAQEEGEVKTFLEARPSELFNCWQVLLRISRVGYSRLSVGQSRREFLAALSHTARARG